MWRIVTFLCFFFCCLSLSASRDCNTTGEITYNFVRRGETIAVPVEAADIVFFVDESGSMNTEHEWLGDVAEKLDEALKTKQVGGAGPNRFALVTFGGRSGDSLTGKVWNVGGVQFGSPAQLRDAFTNLSAAGRLEDGYSAMNVALTKLAFRDNVARQFIVITDENRDVVANLTYDSMLQRLLDNNIVLNTVVNHAFHLNGVQAFGMDREQLCYKAATTEKMFVSKADCSIVVNSGVGTTYDDYVRLAFATGGAAWNLQQLRSGGETTVSFTKAFVGVKVKEVVTQVRECQRCQCKNDFSLECSQPFVVENQEECKVTITTTDSGSATPTPPVIGIGGSVTEEQKTCVLNGQPLFHGSTGSRYIFSRSDFSYNPPSADVVFVVDESGSMRGEHLWLQETIYLLDDALRDEGIGMTEPNRYGLVGFATHGRLGGSVHVLGDGAMGNTTEFADAINRLHTSGQFEDGYRAIATALETFTFRSSNVAKQLILVTDEDRDEMPGSLTSRSVRRLLEEKDFRVNVVVSHNIEDQSGNLLLGIDATKQGYAVSNATSGYAVTPDAVLPSDAGHGSTLEDYVHLALDSSGAAWDLNQLRRGGAIARAFTNSFIDAKRREITEQLKVCETCTCNRGVLACSRREDATTADLCFAPARCRLGRQYVDDNEWSITYSITDQTGLAPMADVVVVVDESRSMIGEHKWLRSVIPELDAALKARRVGVDKQSPNHFGLVGYASNGAGRKDNMGTMFMIDEKEHRMMGSADEFRKVIRQLRQVGRYEDGYSAIMRALGDGKNFRAGAAKLVVLVTDEDRDVLNASLTFDVVYNALRSQGVVLNAVINQGFAVNGKSALGIDGTSSHRGYLLRRQRGDDDEEEVTFKAKRGGVPIRDSGYGTTGTDYAELALNTSGGAWDLNKLRKGGSTAVAFTRAFVAVKVREAVSQLKRCRACECRGGKFECRVYSNVSKQDCKDIRRLIRQGGRGEPTGRIREFKVIEDVAPLVEVYPPSIDVCDGDGFTANCTGHFYNGYSGTAGWVDVPSNGKVTSPSEKTYAVLDVNQVGGPQFQVEYQCKATTNQWQSTASLSVNVVNNAECGKNCVRMNGDGYAMIRRGRNPESSFKTSFKFCPSTVVSGTLYCLENSMSDSDCTQCLVLNDGDLELRWDCCFQRGVPLRYSSSESIALSPGNCYDTFLTITEDTASLTVDAVEVTLPLTAQCSRDYQPSRNFYLGGGTGGTAGGENGYNGCMTGVTLDNKKVLFHDLPTPSPSTTRCKRPTEVHRVRRCTTSCTGTE